MEYSWESASFEIQYNCIYSQKDALMVAPALLC